MLPIQAESLRLRKSHSKLFKVETTLDAKIWFELIDDLFPEFVYADLCITPPWESSTTAGTTTEAETLTIPIQTMPDPTTPPLRVFYHILPKKYH